MTGTVEFVNGRRDTFTVDARCLIKNRETVRRDFAYWYAVTYGEPTPTVTFEDEEKQCQTQ